MKKNLLILEDNSIVRKNLHSIIEKNFGDYIQVYPAGTVTAANEILAQNHMDIFLVDIELGDTKSGADFCEYLRSKENYRNTPIIFETADGNSIVYLLNTLHCYGYLVKPYNVNDLLAMLHAILNHEQSAVQTPIIEENIVINLDGKNMHLDTKQYKIQFANKLSTMVRLSDIIYLEAVQRSVVVHTYDEDFTTRYLTLAKFMEDNSNRYFYRCHNGFVVNTNYFEHFDSLNRVIILKCKGVEYKVDVARHLIKDVKARFLNQ